MSNEKHRFYAKRYHFFRKIPSTRQRRMRRRNGLVLLLLARGAEAARLRPASCTTGSYYIDGEVSFPPEILLELCRKTVGHRTRSSACISRPGTDARARSRKRLGLVRGVGPVPAGILLRL